MAQTHLKALPGPSGNRTVTLRRKNSRVRTIGLNSWQVGRVYKFKQACRWAAAAKSYRTALGVTQQEVDKQYGVGLGSVARWESGHYFGWGKGELDEFCRMVRRCL